ncbi:IAA-alanine resistance protein 1 [Camellia lanceoleosa]|uniref:IAA-alanine resistance protein 1 n=1 Tax=Camellia lanceoleosa TaxID=1840588 RepID=A0ACC0G2Q2_9ERIC|nr:IAA-alanine resistance protein 1 [Camellia lanceoleosa]
MMEGTAATMDLVANPKCSLLVAKDPKDRTDLIITLHGDVSVCRSLLLYHHHKNSKKLKDGNDDDGKIQQQSLNEKNESVSEMSSQGMVLDKGSKKKNQPESLRKAFKMPDSLLGKKSGKTGSGAGKDNISDAPNGSTHHIKSMVEKELSHSPSNLVFGYLNLFSDGVHNFTDGMPLGSAFLLYGSVGGWSRTLFLLADELPQEVRFFLLFLHFLWRF